MNIIVKIHMPFTVINVSFALHALLVSIKNIILHNHNIITLKSNSGLILFNVQLTFTFFQLLQIVSKIPYFQIILNFMFL